MRVLFTDKNAQNNFLYRMLSQFMIREWGKKMTTSEFAVLFFIFDRTLGWGKRTEMISLNQFIKGVTGADGVRYSSGLNLSKSTIQRAIKRLEELGYIAVFRPEDPYTPNTFAILFEEKLSKSARKTIATIVKEKPKKPVDGGLFDYDETAEEESLQRRQASPISDYCS